LADRLAAGPSTKPSAAVRAATVRLVTAVLADPTEASAHATLGRHLIAIGATREGAIEISTACGIAARGEDLVALGEAYASLGALPEALAIYDIALRRGLTPELESQARRRMPEIEEMMRGANTTGP